MCACHLRSSLLIVVVSLAAFAACSGDDDARKPESFSSFDASIVATGGTGGLAASTGGIVAGGASAGVGGLGGALGDAGRDASSFDAGDPRACVGMTACAGACVDTSANPLHCGLCGRTCAATQRCQAGQCIAALGGANADAGTQPDAGAIPGGGTSSGAGADDACSDVAAAGLSLSEISVYQSVKIPIMKGMAAVEPAARNADVVQERDAVFRIHVAPGAGWSARQVSARVDLTSAASPAARRFFAKLSPSVASSDADPASAFRVKVPADAITADASYSVTLVECAASAATMPATGARFPSTGAAPLGARKTGPLRIRIIPLVSGGTMPDVSAEAVETYRKRLFAVYPVTKVEIDVGMPLASSASSMCAHLSAISARRSTDDAPVDLYYYGMTNGTSGGQSGCSNTSTASSRTKAAAGWASSGGRLESGAATMCHELGHSHGRLHAPCQVQDPDPSYPYANADTGVWGYDARSDMYLPPTRKDMMSYCPNPDRTQAWISDYTYKAILARVSAVNALVTQTFIYPASAPKEAWQTLVVDSVGKHWGEYPLWLHGTPDGAPLRAIIHGKSGPLQTIEVYKEELEDGISEGAYQLTLPRPKADWYALEVSGLLAPFAFTRE